MRKNHMGESETKKAVVGHSTVIQRHHLEYPGPGHTERVVYVTKGEHKILTLANWYTKKFVSLGFLSAIMELYFKNIDRAVDLEPEYKRRKHGKK